MSRHIPASYGLVTRFSQTFSSDKSHNEGTLSSLYLLDPPEASSGFLDLFVDIGSDVISVILFVCCFVLSKVPFSRITISVLVN